MEAIYQNIQFFIFCFVTIAITGDFELLEIEKIDKLL